MRNIYIAAAFICFLSSSSYVDAAQPFLIKSNEPNVYTPVGRAFKDRASNVQFEGEGVVVSTLADDISGDRHQRFIIRLTSGQTILIAHNIDVSTRIIGLQKNDV